MLTAGTRLGPYEVVSKLGEGGMGQVWRARDTRLDREVALKLLPAGFADDPDRHARFEREAKLLASLNHPNIAHLYGLEHLAVQADSRQPTAHSSPARPGQSSATPGEPEPGARSPEPDVERASSAIHVLVMELVEGEDLARRLEQGAIPVDEALPIARQVAEALEAAHERGVVHRDLKPANVKLRPDGTVKVLDFGLAKAVDVAAAADPSFSPTMTHAATQAGLILGTAAYMSPEQARGKAVDKRADIWAFGVVLFEMLSGERLFSGETVTDTLAAVVRGEPDWRALPADTPVGVRRLLRRCLQKDPARRLRDIGDARLEITDPGAEAAPGAPAAARAAPRRWLAVIAVAALAAGAAAGFWWAGSGDAAPTEWTATRLGGPDTADCPRLSPDGQLLAFLAIVDGLNQVAVMKPGTGSWTFLTHDRASGLIDSLNWTADGSRILYDRLTDAPAGIYTVPALGGDERLLIENAAMPQSLPDGSLLFVRINGARQHQLHRLWPSSGRIEALPIVVPAYLRGNLRVLRDGHVVVFGQPVAGREHGSALHSLALASGELRRIGPVMPEEDILSLAVRPEDGTVLVSLREADTCSVLELTPGRGFAPRSLMTLLSQPVVETGPQRTLFMSLIDRPGQILRFPESGRGVERMAGGPGLLGGGSGIAGSYAVLPTPDGQVLVTARVGGAWRVLVAAPEKEPRPLVETEESTRGPMTLLGSGRAALMIGIDAAPEIAVVALGTGRILKRLQAPRGVAGMAASPDGGTLYVAADHSISAVPMDGGSVRAVCPGDSLTVDPDSGDLIVKLDEADRFRLVRVPPGGGTPRPIAISGDLRLVVRPLAPGAVRAGRLVLPVATADSWFWHAGVLDLASGRLERIPVDYQTDFHSLTWAPDGSIVGSVLGVRGELWRFAPVSR